MTTSTAPGTSAHQTEIVVETDLPALRITREFSAAPEKVFRAHTDPELVAQWLGPRGLEMRVDAFECRTGGHYRYVHSRDGEEFAFYGSFHEVLPHERIVQTFTYEGMPDAVSLERARFVDLGDGRTRIEGTSLFDSFAARDAMIASGMEHGVREGYERLDELLAR